jgi:putative peptide zinc metalloprotease protein
MGVGVYIVWPAFFTDVSDAYRLDRRGRLRTDLGGIYFNAIYALGALLVFAATGFAPLLVVAALTQAQAFYQLVPFLRLDGYYILGDMIGVPNPFSYVWATVVTIVAPRRSAARRAARASLQAVRRGARITLVVWVVTAIPVLLAALALSVYLLPRSVPAVASTLQSSARTAGVSAREGEWIGATNAAMQFTFMSLPLLGWLSTLWWVAKPAARKFRTLDARWVRTAGAISVSVLALGALAVTLQLRSPERPANIASTPVVLPIDQLIPPPTPEARHDAQPSAAIESGATGGAVASTSAIAGTIERPPPTRWSLTMPVEAIATAASAANGAPTVIGTWTVERGDDFWQIAGHVLTDLHGRAPNAGEHHSYWTKLIDANRDGLVYPDDPGTIFRGQQIEVIVPAVAAVDGSSAEVPMN